VTPYSYHIDRRAVHDFAAGSVVIMAEYKGGKAMALIQWNGGLNVGVIEIDKQHQKLVGMINDLNDAMKQGKGKDILGEIINGLANYTVTHFRIEEKYFDQFGYPDTNNHKKEHLNFTKKVTEFKDRFDKGKIGLSIEIMNFLSNWLQNHIKRVDKKYGPFFNEKGLK
jgi:hemerythrin